MATALEIRSTDDPEHFDLYEGDEKIGEIKRGPLDEYDIAEGDVPYWEVTVWSAMGTRKEWSDNTEDLDEARQFAQELYMDFVKERRELNRPGPGPRVRVISTPTGGQRKR